MFEIFSDIQFAHPFVLVLLPLSLLLLTLALRYFSRYLRSWSSLYATQRHTLYRHPLAHLLSQQLDKKSPATTTRVFWRWFAYAVLISLLHISLSQPYRVGEKLPEPPQYRDIVFLVDTSVSMLLRDYLVNDQRTQRMTVVKSVLQHFIQQLTGSRLGLVIFSEQAYTLVPLTTDHATLRFQLERLQPANLTGRRSDIGNAILYTLNHLQPRLQAGEKPVLVMLTDANRPVRNIDPRAAASLVKQAGLHMHTIAMGAGSEAANDEQAQNSQLIYQPANVALLKTIAAAANGSFFWANNQASLDSALRTIQAEETTNIKVEPVHIHIELYDWPLGLALLWILGWQTLSLLRSFR